MNLQIPKDNENVSDGDDGHSHNFSNCANSGEDKMSDKVYNNGGWADSSSEENIESPDTSPTYTNNYKQVN